MSQRSQLLFDRNGRPGQHDEVGTGECFFDRLGEAIDRSAPNRPAAGALVGVPADDDPSQPAQADPDRGTDEPGSEHGGDRHGQRTRPRTEAIALTETIISANSAGRSAWAPSTLAVSGVGMDVHHDPVGPRRHRRPGPGAPPVPAVPPEWDGSIKIGRCDMPFDQGDRSYVESVASGRFEGSDATLDQDDLVVAFLVDVLGGVEPLLEGGSETSLQLHRPGLAARPRRGA